MDSEAIRSDADAEDDASVLVRPEVSTPVIDEALLAALRAEAVELRERLQFMEWQALSLSTLAKVMQHAHIVLFAIDGQGTTTMSDGRGLELIGQKPGEAVGTSALEAAAGTPAHEHLTRALAGEAVHAVVEAAPGVHFETWYMPLRDHDNRMDGVLGLSVDATDRVASEHALAEKMDVIAEQTRTIRQLAAPIIKVWDGILCMPIIGIVDEGGASRMMESLLEAVVRESARFAILDLTAAETLDTSTVDHVLRIFAAARALGVEGVLSGVRPAVAQTMVSLGIEVGGIRTMRTLHDALGWCLAKGRTR